MKHLIFHSKHVVTQFLITFHTTSHPSLQNYNNANNNNDGDNNDHDDGDSDSDDDSDSDSNDDDDSNDDSDEEFYQLVAVTCEAAVTYFNKYINKTPCYNSEGLYETLYGR